MSKDAESRFPAFTFDAAMRRLTYLMALGCLLVAVSAGLLGTNVLIAAGVGLMIAFAAALAAGLVGFIFGVPYSRDVTGSSTQPTSITSLADGNAQQPSYRPNTSLEQISDWLTKILVGVGLVEIKQAPIGLHELVVYLAPGISSGRQSEALVVSTIVFFSVCGFLFGFLWARLYLRRWLTDADRDLIEKLSRFDADAKAYGLVAQQLGRREDEPAASPEDLQQVIKSASSSTKAHIFELARAASEDTEASEYQTVKNPGAASIFRALIADDSERRYHRNHGELGYTLDRKRPPDLAGAAESLSEAILRRDKLQKKGWRYYEFRRARCRIQQDGDFVARKPSARELRESIENDLKQAKEGDPTKFDKWLADNADVRAWIDLNNVQI